MQISTLTNGGPPASAPVALRSTERATGMAGLIPLLQSGVGRITQEFLDARIARFSFRVTRHELSRGQAVVELRGERVHVGLFHDRAVVALDLKQIDRIYRAPPNRDRVAGPEARTADAEDAQLPVVGFRFEGH